MKYKKIKEATFLSRPNRFIAHVMVDGKEEVVHVKNTGRCKELLYQGATVYLEDYVDDMRGRKTRFSLVAVEKIEEGLKPCIRMVNMDSLAPNKVVAEALNSGTIVLPGMEEGLTRIKPESTFGDSRFDFYVEGYQDCKAFIEVKGVTLEDRGVVRFPDAPTERGIKHINELCKAKEQGYLAYIIFVVQMKDVLYFEPNDETHLKFGEALRVANVKGVQILAYDCHVTESSMEISKPVTVKV